MKCRINLAALCITSLLSILLCFACSFLYAEENNTELPGAAMFGKLDRVKELIGSGASANSQDDGYTALMAAADAGHEDIVSYLLKHGADPNVNSGGTALMGAAMRGHAEVVNTLIQSGANINEVNSSGWTALMFAANASAKSTVQILLDKGADPKIQDKYGWTALKLAEKRKDTETATLIKKHL